MKHARGKNKKRVQAQSRAEDILHYFQSLHQATHDFEISPSCIWNTDETRLNWFEQTKRFVVTSSTARTDNPCGGTHHEVQAGVVYVPFINAAGDKRIDFFVISDDGVSDDALELQGPELLGAGAQVFTDCYDLQAATPFFVRTKNGTMTQKVFKAIALQFAEVVATDRQQHHMVVMDGAPAHMCEAVWADLAVRKIHVMILPPNLTHVLQPLDVMLFGIMLKLSKEVLCHVKARLDLSKYRSSRSLAVGFLCSIIDVCVHATISSTHQSKAFAECAISPQLSLPVRVIPVDVKKRLAIPRDERLKELPDVVKQILRSRPARFALSLQDANSPLSPTSTASELSPHGVDIRQFAKDKLQEALEKFDADSPPRKPARAAARSAAAARSGGGLIGEAQLAAGHCRAERDRLTASRPRRAGRPTRNRVRCDE